MSAVIIPAHPEQILKGLGKLWTQLAHEEKGHGKPTVLRACAMTLIVATDEADAGYIASQTISELMKEHPGRGIVLAITDKAEHDLEARVLAQCWKPFGKAQQICCEEIEITARPSSWPHVGPTIIGLVAADLPVIFWCRHQAALRPDANAEERAGLEAIVALSHKVIFDSRGMSSQDALQLIDGWHKAHRVAADLEWTRLTPWREPLCFIFDNEKRANKFSHFSDFEISHSEEKPPMCALYIAGWLSRAHNAAVTFNQVKGFGPGLQKVVMKSAAETITFERNSAECATLSSTSGPSRRYNFGEPTLTALLTEELSVEGGDPSFSAAITRAKELADAN